MGTHKTNSNAQEKKKNSPIVYAAVSEFVKQSTFYLEVNTSE